jgi:hypothetical protein
VMGGHQVVQIVQLEKYRFNSDYNQVDIHDAPPVPYTFSFTYCVRVLSRQCVIEASGCLFLEWNVSVVLGAKLACEIAMRPPEVLSVDADLCRYELVMFVDEDKHSGREGHVDYGTREKHRCCWGSHQCSENVICCSPSQTTTTRVQM